MDKIIKGKEVKGITNDNTKGNTNGNTDSLKKFKEIHYFINKYEGGYNNDINDNGGETIQGISRKFHPKWSGWEYIDYLKGLGYSVSEINKATLNNKDFQNKVTEFYYNNYYKKYNYDRFGFNLGLVITSGTVLFGFKRISKNLQKIINNNLPKEEHIKVDSYLGKNSYKALDKVLNEVTEKEIAFALLIERVDDILETVKYRPTNIKFQKGWLNRVLKLYNVIKAHKD